MSGDVLHERGATVRGFGNRDSVLRFDPHAADHDAVILVHGMLAGRRSMRSMAARLDLAGYRTLNWSYPTLTRSMLEHAENLSHAIETSLSETSVRRLHFVGHSMGCIILRLALRQIGLPSGGRFVMLAPPNHGSRLTRLPIGPLASWFPQLAELSVDSNSLVNQLPEPCGVEVGVIAADRDCIVDLDSTHLSLQQDHCVVSSSHQRLPSCDDAVDQTVRFLMGGRFQHACEVGTTRHAA